MLRALDREIHAVTFDCWGTLLAFEPHPRKAHRARLEALVRATARSGKTIGLDEAQHLLTTAHRQHLDHWEEARATGSPEIARWALEPLGIREPQIASVLARSFEEASLLDTIPALSGAAQTLHALAKREVRLALVCDTGFSSGRVVRTLLDRVGLLEWLEVLVFSDEAGMPKPHPPVFRAALEGLGSEARHSVHVGDLRRTDVAGARDLGMATVRIREHNDDLANLPDADAVADSHSHLRDILGIGEPGT